MNKLIFKNTNFQSAFYTLLLVGYLLISGLPYLFSVESRVITIPFRAFVLGASFIIIGFNFYSKKLLTRCKLYKKPQNG